MVDSPFLWALEPYRRRWKPLRKFGSIKAVQEVTSDLEKSEKLLLTDTPSYKKKKKSLPNELMKISRLDDHFNKSHSDNNKDKDVAYFQDLENTYKRNRLYVTKTR